MYLFVLLLVTFCQSSAISACPETIVIKNVNWDNFHEADWIRGVDPETINGKW